MTTLLVLALVALVVKFVLSKKSRRRKPIDSALHALTRFASWRKEPRFTPGLRLLTAGAVWAFYVVMGTWWTGYILEGILRGTFCLVVCVAVYGVHQTVSWFLTRRRLTIEAGLPVSFVRMLKDAALERQRFAEVQKRWALACETQRIKWGGHAPPLSRLQQTLAGDVKALIKPGKIGGDIETIMKLAPVILPGIMGCHEVTVLPTGKPGQAWISFYKTPPLARPLAAAELPLSGKDRISFGIEEFGGTAAVKYGLSVLATGETGSGKSKLFANMFMDILRDGRPTEMYFIDPKLVEFARFEDKVGQRIGNIRVMGYTTTVEGADAMLKKFHDDMRIRANRMKAMGLDEITEPTEDFPARVVVADELNELKSIYKTMDSPMVLAISKGRATLDWVMAAVQVSKVSNLGDVRDQFPLRVVMRTATPENTKAALTIGESESGAYCSRIPRSMPGVGYYVTEEGEVRKFRTANFTKAELADLSEGVLPEGTLTEDDMHGTPTFVYVCHSARRCEYVGIAESPRERFAQHARTDSRWCSEHDQQENWWRVHVDPKRIETKLYPSRTAAMAAEARMIRELKPYWNIVHNSDNPLSNKSLSKRPGVRVRARVQGEQLLEAGRGEWAVHQVKKDFRHQERVAAAVQRADEREQRVIAESWAA